MVEEIITALSRIRWLSVIARNSTFTYKGQAIDVKRVGRELGVRYVLEGSVRKGGGRVRITAQLIEAEIGAHLWADRFDRSLEDVFELQEQVAISVAGVIEPTLQAAETARSATRPTSDLSAYDAYLRAYAMYMTSQRQMRQALALLEEAIARDPHYGPALGFAALCCMHLATDASALDRDATRQKGSSEQRTVSETQTTITDQLPSQGEKPLDRGKPIQVTCSGLGRVAREAPTPAARDPYPGRRRLDRCCSPAPLVARPLPRPGIQACRSSPGCATRQEDARLLLWRPFHRPCLERAHSFATGLRFRAVTQARRLPPGFLALDRACAVAIAKGRRGAPSASPRRRSGRRAYPRPDGLARRLAAGSGSCSAASRHPCRCRGRDR